MSELTTNRLNELLNEQADKELTERIRWIFDESNKNCNQIRIDQDIMVGEFTLPKGTWLPQVIIAVERAMFTKFCEDNRARYVNEWLKKVNKTSDESKNLNRGAQ